MRELKDLIRLFEESELSELEIEEDGQRMRLAKPQPMMGGAPVTYSVPVDSSAAQAAAAPPADSGDEKSSGLDLADGQVTIDSPMVGTFYVAPAPGEPPFIQIGDRIEESQTVCIVEAMKLMNEVGAKFPCVIDRILVENGQPVEFGQALFAVQQL